MFLPAIIVTTSQFGRTARENGNRGTDHVHANVMFVLGSTVRGGKVYGRRPGLGESQSACSVELGRDERAKVTAIRERQD
jgi:uncharacterized protein (DUF1501 family)